MSLQTDPKLIELKKEIRVLTAAANPYEGPADTHEGVEFTLLLLTVSVAFIFYACSVLLWSNGRFSSAEDLIASFSLLLGIILLLAVVDRFRNCTKQINPKRQQYEHEIDGYTEKNYREHLQKEYIGALSHYIGSVDSDGRLCRTTTLEVRAAVKAQFGADARFAEHVRKQADYAIEEIGRGLVVRALPQTPSEGLVSVFRFDDCSINGTSVHAERVKRRTAVIEDAEDRVFAAQVKDDTDRAIARLRADGSLLQLRWDAAPPVRRA